MYKTVTIDLQKYEPVYENPVGRIEYYLINMPKEYTREWFTWPDSLFAEYVERLVDENVI